LTGDSAGEWEYDFAPLPAAPKERPYTPPREEPIEYLIEDLKIIWAPRQIGVSDGYLVTAIPASGNDPSKGAGENVQKVSVTVEEQKPAGAKEDKVSLNDKMAVVM
jgi:hypothetical protein